MSFSKENIYIRVHIYVSKYDCIDSVADKCGAEEIWLNCRDTRSLAAGTTGSVKLSRFFDCVIEKREALSSSSSTTNIYGNCFNAASPPDRRRPTASSPPRAAAADFSMYGATAIPLLDTNDLK